MKEQVSFEKLSLSALRRCALSLGSPTRPNCTMASWCGRAEHDNGVKDPVSDLYHCSKEALTKKVSERFHSEKWEIDVVETLKEFLLGITPTAPLQVLVPRPVTAKGLPLSRFLGNKSDKAEGYERASSQREKCKVSSMSEKTAAAVHPCRIKRWGEELTQELDVASEGTTKKPCLSVGLSRMRTRSAMSTRPDNITDGKKETLVKGAPATVGTANRLFGNKPSDKPARTTGSCRGNAMASTGTITTVGDSSTSPDEYDIPYSPETSSEASRQRITVGSNIWNWDANGRNALLAQRRLRGDKTAPLASPMRRSSWEGRLRARQQSVLPSVPPAVGPGGNIMLNEGKPRKRRSTGKQKESTGLQTDTLSVAMLSPDGDNHSCLSISACGIKRRRC